MELKDVQWATLEPSGQLGYSLAEKKKFATKEDIDKIHEMLSHLISQNDISISQLQSKNKTTESSSNLFSEIEGGHSPSKPDRFE
ncbi:YetF domain-containing protein [Peribacillus frigoritolerans]|uniref:DUF421 domain-containing protein n=1 Tax=Peribacillus castrilensis TaxID=2897690 RepID=A0AAW9NHU5_9BACI|nr:DUF421 domain-containing protein [Peribacillus castrilensis]